jgi:ribonuclease P protein component
MAPRLRRDIIMSSAPVARSRRCRRWLPRADVGPIALRGRMCARDAHLQQHRLLYQVTATGAVRTPDPAEEDPREAHIPAQQPPPGQAAWVSRPHVDPGRARRAEEPSRQGPRPLVGLIHRIRGRDAFGRLAHDGMRIRRPALWCTWCPDPSTTTMSVAFSLSRALGPAVVRNRLRRRLRSILRESETTLPGGMMLIGATPAAVELTFDQLRAELSQLLMTAAARTAPRVTGPRAR